ncbi:OmpP1/FadL family transporter [Verrucomicrobiota bacterium]
MQKKSLPTIAATLTILTTTAWGGGFQLYNEGSAEALGQASAITARDDLTSLAWYNPAGLAGTDQQSVMIGNTFILLKSDFDGDSFDEKMEPHWRSIPHAYYVQPIDNTKTFTLSLNSPYGLITEWPGNGQLRSLSEKAELTTFYATPSLAFKTDDSLSVSVGLNVVYAKAKLRDASTVLKGEDSGIGATASLHYQLNDDLALGARYQSEVHLTLEGELNSTIEAEAEATMPDSFTFGATYSGIKKWKFGLDAVWTDWTDFDQILIDLPPPLTDSVRPQNWDDVWGIHFGAEYQLNKNWVLRGGYVWDESPVSDEYRSPMLPGSDRQLVMGGFARSFKQWTLDAAYCYIWAKDTQQGSEFPAAFAGEYENTAHLLSFSIGYDF